MTKWCSKPQNSCYVYHSLNRVITVDYTYKRIRVFHVYLTCILKRILWQITIEITDVKPNFLISWFPVMSVMIFLDLWASLWDFEKCHIPHICVNKSAHCWCRPKDTLACCSSWPCNSLSLILFSILFFANLILYLEWQYFTASDIIAL